MPDILLAFLAFLLTLAGVWVYRRIAVRIGAIDVPNERSSHRRPVPRGGGIVLSIVCLIFFWLAGGNFGNIGNFGKNGNFGNFGNIGNFGVLISLVGFYDDLRPMKIGPRLFMQILISAIFLMVLFYGQAPPVAPVIFYPVSIIWFVAVINAFNFLDGIDGMIALAAFTGGVFWRFFAVGAELGSLSAAAAIIASVSLAFFLFNRQPASVFLGDSGSMFLGFVFAALPLTAIRESAGEREAMMAVAAGAIFIWPLLADAILTRIWRVWRVRRFWEPNRDHFYQRLVDSGRLSPERSHRFVSALYALAVAMAGAIFLIFEVEGGNFPLLTVSFIIACIGAAVLWSFRLEKRRPADGSV